MPGGNPAGAKPVTRIHSGAGNFRGDGPAGTPDFRPVAILPTVSGVAPGF